MELYYHHAKGLPFIEFETLTDKKKITLFIEIIFLEEIEE